MALLFIVPLLFFGVCAQPEEHVAIQPEQKKMIGDVNDTLPARLTPEEEAKCNSGKHFLSPTLTIFIPPPPLFIKTTSNPFYSSRTGARMPDPFQNLTHSDAEEENKWDQQWGGDRDAHDRSDVAT